jgi:sugar lactone lactonase YvrE
MPKLAVRPNISLVLGALLWSICAGSALGKAPELQLVAHFADDQPAGVAVSNAGRIFVTFPRHTGTVDFTVGEVRDGRTTPFPNAEVNAAQTEKPADTLFSVQSLVIDSSNRLWLLDTGVMKVGEPPILGAPKLIVVDLSTDRIVERFPIPKDALVKNSALKDFRIDFRRGLGGVAFVTDSAPGSEALIVIDLASGRAMRRLSGSAVVGPGTGVVPVVEGTQLFVRPKGGRPHPFAVGLNGVELSPDGETLYFNAFTGRHLLAVSARDLSDPTVPDSKIIAEVRDAGSIGVAGHLAIDARGRLYVMDMERNAIFRRSSSGSFQMLISNPQLLWPDTMAVGPDGYLYVTSSQHNRGPLFHAGEDLRRKPFSLYRVWIGAGPVRP